MMHKSGLHNCSGNPLPIIPAPIIPIFILCHLISHWDLSCVHTENLQNSGKLVCDLFSRILTNLKIWIPTDLPILRLNFMKLFSDLKFFHFGALGGALKVRGDLQKPWFCLIFLKDFHWNYKGKNVDPNFETTSWPQNVFFKSAKESINFSPRTVWIQVFSFGNLTVF